MLSEKSRSRFASSLFVKVCACIVLLLTSALACGIANAAGPRVYYAGFAYSGKFKDINLNYGYTSKLNASVAGSAQLSDAVFNLVKENQANCGYRLCLSKAEGRDSPGATVVMTVAVTREDFYTERLADCNKNVLNLALRLLLIDMDSKTVLSSVPIVLEMVDVSSTDVDDSYRMELVRKAYLGDGSNPSVMSLLSDRLKSLKIPNSTSRTIQVAKVCIDEQAVKLVLGNRSKNDYSLIVDSLAQRFSDELSRKANACVLPSGRDAINGKCSLVFSDGKEQDFQIPQTSYAVDVSVEQVKKKDLGDNGIERAYAYGAYIKTSVYVPEFSSRLYEKQTILGVAKKFAVTTVNFDEPLIYKEVIDGAIAKSVTDMMDDKKCKREVLDRCVVY